jgi:predicted aspartyl protease
MIRYRYTGLTPPDPMIHVAIRCPSRGTEATGVVALIDTGADRTVLPRTVIDALALAVTGVERFQGFAGQIVELSVYVVDLSIHDLPAVRIEPVLGEAEKYVLLGRDVLNAHRILLDGPQLALEIG